MSTSMDTEHMQSNAPAAPTREDNEPFLASEVRWREAHRIVATNPSLDLGDVYHALTYLELPPAERLRRGLTRVRIRPHSS